MDVLYFFSENAAKIMIGTGFLLVIFGVLTLTTFFTIIPLLTLSIGITLLVFGFFARMNLFSIEWRSLNGVATVLLCIAVGFFAVAVSSIQFQEVTTIIAAPVRFDGSSLYPTGLIHEGSIILTTERPFMSLFAIAAQLGLACLLISIAAKGYISLRSVL